MNETTQLEVIELGDAKTLTQGELNQIYSEDNEELPTRSTP